MVKTLKPRNPTAAKFHHLNAVMDCLGMGIENPADQDAETVGTSCGVPVTLPPHASILRELASDPKSRYYSYWDTSTLTINIVLLSLKARENFELVFPWIVYRVWDTMYTCPLRSGVADTLAKAAIAADIPCVLEFASRNLTKDSRNAWILLQAAVVHGAIGCLRFLLDQCTVVPLSKLVRQKKGDVVFNLIGFASQTHWDLGKQRNHIEILRYLVSRFPDVQDVRDSPAISDIDLYGHFSRTTAASYVQAIGTSTYQDNKLEVLVVLLGNRRAMDAIRELAPNSWADIRDWKFRPLRYPGVTESEKHIEFFSTCFTACPDLDPIAADIPILFSTYERWVQAKPFILATPVEKLSVWVAAGSGNFNAPMLRWIRDQFPGCPGPDVAGSVLNIPYYLSNYQTLDLDRSEKKRRLGEYVAFVEEVCGSSKTHILLLAYFYLGDAEGWRRLRDTGYELGQFDDLYCSSPGTTIKDYERADTEFLVDLAGLGYFSRYPEVQGLVVWKCMMAGVTDDRLASLLGTDGPRTIDLADLGDRLRASAPKPVLSTFPAFLRYFSVCARGSVRQAQETELGPETLDVYARYGTETLDLEFLGILESATGRARSRADVVDALFRAGAAGSRDLVARLFDEYAPEPVGSRDPVCQAADQDAGNPGAGSGSRKRQKISGDA